MGTGKQKSTDHNSPQARKDKNVLENYHQQEGPELDDFGLAKKPGRRLPPPEDGDSENDDFHDADDGRIGEPAVPATRPAPTVAEAQEEVRSDNAIQVEKSEESRGPAQEKGVSAKAQTPDLPSTIAGKGSESENSSPNEAATPPQASTTSSDAVAASTQPDRPSTPQPPSTPQRPQVNTDVDTSSPDAVKSSPMSKNDGTPKRHKSKKSEAPAVSEWSHQRLAPQKEEEVEEEEVEWQSMPAVAHYDLYNDNGKLVAKGAESEDEEEVAYGGLGGAGKGYTRVQLDEDAKSTTSMDEETNYLFKEKQMTNALEEEEDQRNAGDQLQATKDLLTEAQRIAYVGVTRLTMFNMLKELEDVKTSRSTKKVLARAIESTTKWGQQMMVRLYAHMEIDSAEQLMIEQLAEHGVQPKDLVPPLMLNSRVDNPMADQKSPGAKSENGTELQAPPSATAESLAPEENGSDPVPRVHTPSQMETTEKIDLDLRWTVLCDLFLLLISDSIYDARSRRLLEQVANAMEISWVQICRFEKRVIDALEMQEEARQENWNEEEHMEKRRVMGLKKKYMVMGIATVGGGLVIGLSAGLLAPVIGAGLAAGFTTIGVTGTAGFLGGVGGAALITSAATAAGGTIAVRASHRRTGAVRTFEYRPLHNNKRLNLILTVSGWMNGKVDDVRLPYSTVDPIMGDIYSLLWEPEMLQSMGETINILATEALTQTVQQVLGSTILVGLMAAVQLPVLLTKLSYLIDNPWTVSLDRANSAGLILADSLMDRHLGNRPITLLGFSLGSRVIFSCLRELAARGAHGLIQNVYLFGSPVVGNKDEYLKARSIVSGRFVNGYSSNDWILGYLFRATSGGIMRIAGLAPVEDVPGVENLDVTALVNGHMAYRTAMPKLLKEVGWEVESEVFTEVEDPDPENHQKRQRELIREIDEARKAQEDKAGKRMFGLFKRSRPAEKKGWETYEADDGSIDKRPSSDGDRGLSNNVLFDIEAIRRELESEMIEVKQLESTMPPMRLDTNGPLAVSPRSNLRQTQSSSPSMGTETRSDLPTYESMSVGGHDQKQNLSPRSPDLNGSYPSPTGEQQIQMTFEESPGQENHPTFAAFDYSIPEKSSSPPYIPERTTSKKHSPVTPDMGGLNFEHNAWADDDDFGKEREVKMTFE